MARHRRAEKLLFTVGWNAAKTLVSRRACSAFWGQHENAEQARAANKFLLIKRANRCHAHACVGMHPDFAVFSTPTIGHMAQRPKRPT